MLRWPRRTPCCGAKRRGTTGGTYAGAAYLVLGSSGPSSMSLSSADAELWGEAPNHQAGTALTGAGDVDGDGYADLLIGAPNGGARYDGAAYLVLGSSAPLSMSLSAADAVYVGEAAYDYAGTSVAGAGDVDADGRDDLLVGAHQNDDGGADAGAVYLVLGSSAPASMSLSSAAAQLSGEAAGDHAGASAAGAGDADGDGFADVLVGARRNDRTGLEGGAAYLVLGGGM